MAGIRAALKVIEIIYSARTLSLSRILLLLSLLSKVFGIIIPANTITNLKGAGVGLLSLLINLAKVLALTLVVIVTPTSIKYIVLLDKAIFYS